MINVVIITIKWEYVLTYVSYQVLYTTRVRHAAPIALNLLTNMLGGAHAQAEVATYNHPLEGKAGPARQDLVQPKSLIMSVMWATVVVFGKFTYIKYRWR